MSFAKTIKEEIGMLDTDNKESLAELAALLHLNAELVISEKTAIDFHTSNPSVAKRFLTLIKKLYHPETELISKKEDKLHRKYWLTIRIKSNISEIMSEHPILEAKTLERDLLLFDDDTKRAYLRGAFLAAGSVNSPEKAEYHLELYCRNATEILYLQKIMNEFNLDARITKRRQGYIVYLKKLEAITDFLQLIGAQRGFFTFQDILIHRDFKNSINRLNNCDNANEFKVIRNAHRQLKDIAVIEEKMGFQHLTEKIMRVVILRKEYEEASLKELVELYKEKYHENITKSGLNHRFQKINELAAELKQ